MASAQRSISNALKSKRMYGMAYHRMAYVRGGSIGSGSARNSVANHVA